MPQLIQHRLKTNIHSRTGHNQPRGNFVHKITDEQLAMPVWSTLPSVDVAQAGAWTLDLSDYCHSTETITYTVNTGTLPTGITLNANGTFAGTVTNVGGAGSVTFTATTTSATANSGTLGWTIP